MESQVDKTPFDAFPEDVRPDIDGLIWLGYLEDVVSYCGHDFVIRTLRGEEELMAARVIKDYMETMGQAKAHVWATISLALYAVDGAEDFCPPISPNKMDFARARFQWVTKNWYWPLAIHLYDKYLELLKRQQKALDEIEGFLAENPLSHMPFAGSWTDKEFSAPEEDIRDYLNPEDSTPSS